MTRPVRRVHTYVVLPIALAALAAACSQTGSPEAPSSPGSSGSGVTIVGQVSSGGSTAERAADTTSNLIVTVTGTNVSTHVQNGQFTLENVPAGDVSLRFTGQAIDATLTLADLSEGDQVRIVVSVSGSHATLESEQSSHPGDDGVELEGEITSIDVAGQTLVVNGKTVSVPPTVTIRHGNTSVAFADLQVGQRVHVKGTAQGTPIVATEVILQNEHTSNGNGGGD